jgi:acyl carrier protein
VSVETVSCLETVATMSQVLLQTPATIAPESRLKEDLALHSLSMMELALGLEEVMELRAIDFEDFFDLQTVGELVTGLESAVAEGKGSPATRTALDAWMSGYVA